jgi:hypothetical protein
MHFHNVTNEIKKTIVQEALVKYEKSVYELIIKLGLDPNTFESSSFDPEEEGHPAHTISERIELKKSLISLETLNTELEAVS